MEYTKNERLLLSGFSIVLGIFATGVVWWSAGPWTVLGMYCALGANNLSQDIKHLNKGA